MMTGDDEFDFKLIRLHLLNNDFDLDKTIKATKRFGAGKRRILAALARLEVNITNVERSTHNPEQRLVLRRLLASIRKNRQAPPEAAAC